MSELVGIEAAGACSNAIRNCVHSVQSNPDTSSGRAFGDSAMSQHDTGSLLPGAEWLGTAVCMTACLPACLPACPLIDCFTQSPLPTAASVVVGCSRLRCVGSMSSLSSRPPRPSRPSRSSVRPTAVLAGCVAAALGAGAFAIWYWRRRASTATALSASASSEPRPPPPHYPQHVTALIQHIATTGQLDSLHIQQHRAHLRWLELHNADTDTDVAAACVSVVQLLTTYHTLRHLHIAQTFDPSNPQTVTALHQWEAEQTDDLERAWHILHSPAVSAAVSSSTAQSSTSASSVVAASSSVPLLCLELAQRLKRADRLTAAYDTVMRTTPDSMSEEQLIAAFMTAPLLGQWRDVRRLGRQLIATKGANVMNGTRTLTAAHPSTALSAAEPVQAAIVD